MYRRTSDLYKCVVTSFGSLLVRLTDGATITGAAVILVWFIVALVVIITTREPANRFLFSNIEINIKETFY